MTRKTENTYLEKGCVVGLIGLCPVSRCRYWFFFPSRDDEPCPNTAKSLFLHQPPTRAKWEWELKIKPVSQFIIRGQLGWEENWKNDKLQQTSGARQSWSIVVQKDNIVKKLLGLHLQRRLWVYTQFMNPKSDARPDVLMRQKRIYWMRRRMSVSFSFSLCPSWSLSVCCEWCANAENRA